MGYSIGDIARAGEAVAAPVFIGGPQAIDAVTGRSDQKKANAAFGRTEEEAEKAYQESLKQIQADQGTQKSINAQMGQTAQNYNTTGQSITDAYTKDIDWLMDQAQNQHTDARKTYTNSIQPAMKNNMELAQRNAMGAMSLEEAQNQNNALQSGIRNFYNDQSQGAMRTGMQSAGIADAFAAQQAEMANRNGPMTGAQQQQAYANASQQGNQVRGNTMAKAGAIQDQGMQLAQQANDQAYAQGQRAQDEAAGATNDYQQGMMNFNDTMANSRGSINDLMNEKLGAGWGNNESQYATNQATKDREYQTEEDAIKNQIAALQQKYGIQSGSKGAQAQASAGKAQGIGDLMGSVVSTGGKMLGGAA